MVNWGGMEEERKSDTPAEQAVDPDRLLDGEDPETTHVDDAEHWVSVYRDLVKSKQELIGVTEHRMNQVAEDAAQELGHTDLEILEREHSRFRRRLSFWEARLAHLTAADGR
jgi:hypothetical protein